jgi:hypothetical protein
MSCYMNPSHEHAPLVALTVEEAAQNMVSEGGPVNRPVPREQQAAPNEVMKHLRQEAEAQFYAHPLTTMLITFGVGVIIGAAARRVA